MKSFFAPKSCVTGDNKHIPTTTGCRPNNQTESQPIGTQEGSPSPPSPA